MRLFQALRRKREEATGACVACVHFCDDPAEIEQALPGLAVLSSGYASVRGDDGLCGRHDRLASRRGSCAAYACASMDAEPALGA